MAQFACPFDSYSDGGYHTTLSVAIESDFMCRCQLYFSYRVEHTVNALVETFNKSGSNVLLKFQ